MTRRLDQFYTKPEIARQCFDFLAKNINPCEYNLWIEPSAGEGSFYNILPEPKIGIELVSNIPSYINADFLKWQPESHYNRAIAVGNPPFGKNASLAIKFFNHAASMVNCIAMIFPRTFQKDSIKNKLELLFHLEAEHLLPEDAFTYEGRDYSVPAVFQIWIRKTILRQKHYPKLIHEDFLFTTKENADFAVQRVGVNAGKIKDNLKEISPSSHYFIKAQNSAIKATFRRIDFASVKYKTAGNPSISKGELINLYEGCL